MNQGSENRERCKTKTETNARMEGCVTRIDGVDDVVREESEERRKQDEEEELGERGEDHAQARSSTTE